MQYAIQYGTPYVYALPHSPTPPPSALKCKAYARVHRRERNFGDSPLDDQVGRGLVKFGSKKLELQTPSIGGGGLMEDIFERVTPGMWIKVGEHYVQLDLERPVRR